MNSNFPRTESRETVEGVLVAISSLAEKFWEDRSQVLNDFYGDIFDGCEICQAMISESSRAFGVTPTHCMVHKETTFALKFDTTGAQDLRGLADCIASSMHGDIVMTETLREDWSKLHSHAARHSVRGSYSEAILLYKMALHNEAVRRKVMKIKCGVVKGLRVVADYLDAERFATAQCNAERICSTVEDGFREIIQSYSKFAPLPH